MTSLDSPLNKLSSDIMKCCSSKVLEEYDDVDDVGRVYRLKNCFRWQSIFFIHVGQLFIHVGRLSIHVGRLFIHGG